MPQRTGALAHVSWLGGAVVALEAAESPAGEGADDFSRRVWLGPDLHRRADGSEDTTASELRLYTSGDRAVHLFTNPLSEGHLRLFARGAFAGELPWFVWTGIGTVPPPVPVQGRAGFLDLRGIAPLAGEPGPYTVLRLGGERGRGNIPTIGELILYAWGQRLVRMGRDPSESREGRIYLYDIQGSKVVLGPVHGAGALRLFARPEMEVDGETRRQRRRVAVVDGVLAGGERYSGQVRIYHTARTASVGTLGVGETGAFLALGTWARDSDPAEGVRPRPVHVDRDGFRVGTPTLRRAPGELGRIGVPGEDGIAAGVGGGGGIRREGVAPEFEFPEAEPPEPGYAFLGLDAEGTRGYLELRSEGRAVRIDPTGVRWSPAKDAAVEWNLVAEHPTDPTKEIYYCVAEGPEVGVYVRGTAHLVEGRARVPLPEHFSFVAADRGLTVQLTPRSRSSRGVAATRLTPEEIVLEELGEGGGTYDVDYLVQGVRRGSEDYEVVRARPATDADRNGVGTAREP